MKYLFYSLLILGLFIEKSNAQTCGTLSPTNPSIYADEPDVRGASSGYCVDIFFHIVRNDNGSNAFPNPNTDEIIENLNEVFSPHNIILNNSGRAFINDSDFLKINDENFDIPHEKEDEALANEFNLDDAINFYIVESAFGQFGQSISGTAINVLSNNLIVTHDNVLNSTAPHELGHCLNLIHTHRGFLGERVVKRRLMALTVLLVEI